MTTSTSLRHEIDQLQAAIYSALADPSRLSIIRALSERSLNVGDLAEQVGINQTTASRHLKVLRDQELVRSIRHGQSIEYRLNDYRLLKAMGVISTILRDRLARRANLFTAE